MGYVEGGLDIEGVAVAFARGNVGVVKLFVSIDTEVGKLLAFDGAEGDNSELDGFD